MRFRPSLTAPLLILLSGCSIAPSDSPLGPGASEESKSRAYEAQASAGSAPSVRVEDPKRGGSAPRGPRVDVSELVSAANQSAMSGDLDNAERLLEKAIAQEPTNRKALLILAAVDQDLGNNSERPASLRYYHKSAAIMRQLRDSSKERIESQDVVGRMAYFNEARAFALEGQPEKAIDALAEAIEEGYRRTETLRTEKDLDPLRSSPRFAGLLNEADKKARLWTHEFAKKLLSENQSFPFDFKLPDLEGKLVSLADFRGQVLIVDLWATWCPPCRMEVPHLVEISKEYRDKGVRVVGLNFERTTDEEEARKKIAEFVKENHVSYPCLIGNEKIVEQVKDFEGFPTALFLDRSGKIRAKITGFDPEVVKVMEEILSILASEDQGKSPARS